MSVLIVNCFQVKHAHFLFIFFPSLSYILLFLHHIHVLEAILVLLGEAHVLVFSAETVACVVLMFPNCTVPSY